MIHQGFLISGFETSFLRVGWLASLSSDEPEPGL